MSGTTPGQAAYEAWHKTGDAGARWPVPWEDQPAEIREAWEAAAQAAIDHDRLHHGNPLAPAITGAGTDHLAKQLLDPNYPDGPAWQPVPDMPAQDR